jgi:hypothetical protein
MVRRENEMEIRRYYKKGVKYPYYIDDGILEDMRNDFNDIEASALDNAESEIKLSTGEQVTWFMETLNNILDNPRYFLDNLDYIPEYQVNWNNYGKRNMKWHCGICGKNKKLSDKSPCVICGNTEFKKIRFGINYLRSKPKHLMNLKDS